MQKYRAILAEFHLLLILVFSALVVGFLIFCAYFVATDDSPAKARVYADQAIVDIATGWNEQALQTRAVRKFEESLIRDSAILNRFERYKKWGGYKGHRITFTSIDHRGKYQPTVSTYSADITFEKGTAVISLEIVWLKGQQRIRKFEITPEEPSSK